MALIQCPDCGASVSDSAVACPQCARPIVGTGSFKATPPTQKKTGVSAAFALLVFIALGGWIYYQATSTDDSSTANSSQASAAAGDSPAETSQPASHEQAAPTYITTPESLYQAYESNEVATDQMLAGKVIQFTAPVKSIDKDFTDTAVLKFSTGDEFSDLQASLEDSDKAAAAQLSQGEIVTVRCEKFERMMGSPVGVSCTFQVGDQRPPASSENQPSASVDGGSMSTQRLASDTPQAAGSSPATAAMASPASSAPDSSSSAGQDEDVASGPSFDCSRAAGPATRTICSNSALSELDAQMAILYHTRTNYAQDQNVREVQKAWLSERDACGADAVCLREKYMQRIQQLQQ